MKDLYDKTIPKYKAINNNMKTIGLAYEFQKTEFVAEAHDVQLDFIVTEKTFIVKRTPYHAI